MTLIDARTRFKFQVIDKDFSRSSGNLSSFYVEKLAMLATDYCVLRGFLVAVVYSSVTVSGSG